MANSWYAYKGYGDPFVPSSYYKVTVEPACVDGSSICAVYILNETNPVPLDPFTDNILTYMANGLATSTRKPDSAGQKPYVYLKNL